MARAAGVQLNSTRANVYSACSFGTLSGIAELIGVVLAVGVVQDRALDGLRRALCPYAELTHERAR